MMNARSLESEADYDAALEKIADFFKEQPRPGTPEAHQFDELALLIANYEKLHWSMAED